MYNVQYFLQNPECVKIHLINIKSIHEKTKGHLSSYVTFES